MSLSSSCASQVDGPTRRALVAFSYHLTIGNMDEAHRAVKLVKSAQAWHASPSVAALPRPTARLEALSTRTRVRAPRTPSSWTPAPTRPAAQQLSRASPTGVGEYGAHVRENQAA